MEHMAWYAVAAMVVANLADIVTTIKALQRGAVEKNPIVRWTMERLGKAWPVAKSIPTALCVWWAYAFPMDAELTFLAGFGTVLYGLAAAHNHKLERGK